MSSQKLTAAELVQKLNEPNKKNAIRDMYFSKVLFLTKGGKPYSHIANAYLDKMKKYLPYIIKGKEEQFMEECSNTFEYVESPNDEDVYYELLNWEQTCAIMEMLDGSTNWSAVDKQINEQGHSGYSMGRMAGKIEFFSPYGTDFIKHVYTK